jgi:hypothetical protein
MIATLNAMLRDGAGWQRLTVSTRMVHGMP